MSALDVDDAAMSRLADGDDDALNELMGRWKQKAAAFLFRFVGDATIAIELTEETFIRVYQQRARYRPMGRFSTWFFQIASNLARQRARWKQRHPESSLDELSESGHLEMDCVTNADPASELLRKERAQAVQRAIQKLPEDQRTSLILQEYENLTVREIAAIQKSSEKAVENRLGRARKALREQLGRLLSAEV